MGTYAQSGSSHLREWHWRSRSTSQQIATAPGEPVSTIEYDVDTAAPTRCRTEHHAGREHGVTLVNEVLTYTVNYNGVRQVPPTTVPRVREIAGAAAPTDDVRVPEVVGRRTPRSVRATVVLHAAHDGGGSTSFAL